MTPIEMKQRLQSQGEYNGPLDNKFDATLRQAVLRAMADGPDTPLTEADFQLAASTLHCPVAAIKAVCAVEASGAAFIAGKPPILFEPHRFSRATGHRFDASHPLISSRYWNRKLYPASQAGRWTQLLDAATLDINAAFASASYGMFQILGENWKTCGASDPFDFAWQESRDAQHQLSHFLNFVRRNHLDGHLARLDWASFARGYNGTAYAQNHYDARLAHAYQEALNG